MPILYWQLAWKVSFGNFFWGPWLWLLADKKCLRSNDRLIALISHQASNLLFIFSHNCWMVRKWTNNRNIFQIASYKVSSVSICKSTHIFKILPMWNHIFYFLLPFFTNSRLPWFCTVCSRSKMSKGNWFQHRNWCSGFAICIVYNSCFTKHGVKIAYFCYYITISFSHVFFWTLCTYGTTKTSFLSPICNYIRTYLFTFSKWPL